MVQPGAWTNKLAFSKIGPFEFQACPGVKWLQWG